MVRVSFISFFITCLIILSSCTKKEQNQNNSGAANKTVSLAIWTRYIAPELVSEFEAQTGYKVEISNYASNEELLAKLQAGASGYDVIVPSDYMVFVMHQQNLLQKLDHSKLPNKKNIDKNFDGKDYDPDHSFSVPYGWTSTGIAYNKKYLKKEVTSWKDLFENQDVYNKFSLLDDAREATSASLKLRGLSLNSIEDADLSQAKKVLSEARKHVKTFTSEPMPLLLTGDVIIAHEYSSSALQTQEKNSDIGFVIPKEGATMAIDNLAITSTSKNLEGAYALINFMLDKNHHARNIQVVKCGPVLSNVKEILPKEMQNNHVLFPPEESMRKAELMHDLGEANRKWDRIWTEVKAGKE